MPLLASHSSRHRSKALPAAPLRAPIPPSLPRQATRDFKRRRRKIARKEAEDEYLVAQDTLLAENLPATTTWWMGTPFAQRPSRLLRQAHAAGSLADVWTYLSGIRLVPYQG